MQIIVCENYDQMSFQGAEIIKSILLHNPSAVLGLATGSTPIGMYGLLAEACARGEISFAAARTVNLDEYVGLGEKDSQSYVHFMRENLFDKVDVPMANTHLPNGKAADLAAECARYSALLATMPQDVQVLGLGSNGHIGFNEPGSVFEKETHCVTLSDTTREANARFFSSMDEVPTEAYTMGIGSIMQAKKIIVIVTGEGKREIVKKAFQGPITPEVQASVLQLHKDVILVGDEAALAGF